MGEGLTGASYKTGSFMIEAMESLSSIGRMRTYGIIGSELLNTQIGSVVSHFADPSVYEDLYQRYFLRIAA